ncbi:MAG TPA: pilus assembly protein TadG-related protein [Nocardioides sp.]|nr:pilus assembly protein TadG-related protein [Nocardioides sp.]
MRTDERGQASLMIIGFAVVIVSLIVVVVDASVAFLERQGLDNLADGAALYGADQAAEGTDVYTGGIGHGDLDLTAARARAGVLEYLRKTGAYADHPGLSAAVSVHGDAVVVRLSARVDLPFSVPGGPESARVASTGSAVVRPD